MPDHWVTERIHAPCHGGREHGTGPVTHVVGTLFYCALHCVRCNPAPHEFPEALPGTLTGKQSELFNG